MIGELRQRLTLQEPVRTPDDGGGFTTVFENVTLTPVIFAQVTPLSGAEQLKSGKLSATLVYRIVIRYRADITTDMRLVDGDKIYTITAAADKDGRQNYLEIIAERRA